MFNTEKELLEEFDNLDTNDPDAMEAFRQKAEDARSRAELLRTNITASFLHAELEDFIAGMTDLVSNVEYEIQNYDENNDPAENYGCYVYHKRNGQ